MVTPPFHQPFSVAVIVSHLPPDEPGISKEKLVAPERANTNEHGVLPHFSSGDTFSICPNHDVVLGMGTDDAVVQKQHDESVTHQISVLVRFLVKR